MHKSLTFHSRDPFNSNISEKDTGRPLYTVVTTGGPLFKTRRTTLTAVHVGDKPFVVGEVEWKRLGAPTVTYAGETMSLATFLPKIDRVFHGPYWSIRIKDNQEYVWERENAAWTLRNDATHACIAQRHPEWKSDRDLTLDVYGEGLEISDLVVLTFAILEHRRRFDRGREKIGNTRMVTTATTGVLGF